MTLNRDWRMRATLGNKVIYKRYIRTIENLDEELIPGGMVIKGSAILKADISTKTRGSRWPVDFNTNGVILKTRPN